MWYLTFPVISIQPDTFTKHLGKVRLARFREMLGLQGYGSCDASGSRVGGVLTYHPIHTCIMSSVWMDHAFMGCDDIPGHPGCGPVPI